MGNLYLLLRNNTQSGPYTIEELKAMSVQSYDLIWTLDQGTSWQFPEEIPALKNDVSSIISTPKTTASQIYVSLLQQEEKKTPQQETEPSFEERVQRLKDQSVKKQDTSVSANEINTNYTRSLDDIKAEYSNWLQHQKKGQGGRFLKKSVLALLFIGMVAASFLMAKSLLSPTSEASAAGKTYVKKEVSTESVPENVPDATQEPEVIQEAILRSTTTVKPKAKKTINTPQENRKQVSLPVTEAVTKVEQPAISDNKENQSVSIAQQIHLKAEYIGNGKQQGIGGLNVMLRNESKQILKVVAVDVIYFTDLDNEVQRKTLYFNNVAPGEMKTQVAPANKQAEGAFARLGLISSEGGSIFFARN